MLSFTVWFLLIVLIVVCYFTVGILVTKIPNEEEMLSGSINWKSALKRAAVWPKVFFSSILVLIVLCLPVVSGAYTVNLQWDPVTDSDLAGYKLYYANTNIQPFRGTGATQGASGDVVIPREHRQ